MVKKFIYITEEHEQWIKKLAMRRTTSFSGAIRQIIIDYFKLQADQDIRQAKDIKNY